MTVRDRDPGPDGPNDSAAARGAARRRINAPAWNLLLLLPLAGVLIPPIFNKTDPTLFDIPFFYWYQLLWIVISVLLTVLVYRMTRGER